MQPWYIKSCTAPNAHTATMAHPFCCSTHLRPANTPPHHLACTANQPNNNNPCTTTVVAIHHINNKQRDDITYHMLCIKPIDHLMLNNKTRQETNNIVFLMGHYATGYQLQLVTTTDITDCFTPIVCSCCMEYFQPLNLMPHPYPSSILTMITTQQQTIQDNKEPITPHTTTGLQAKLSTVLMHHDGNSPNIQNCNNQTHMSAQHDKLLPTPPFVIDNNITPEHCSSTITAHQSLATLSISNRQCKQYLHLTQR